MTLKVNLLAGTTLTECPTCGQPVTNTQAQQIHAKAAQQLEEIRGQVALEYQGREVGLIAETKAEMQAEIDHLKAGQDTAVAARLGAITKPLRDEIARLNDVNMKALAEVAGLKDKLEHQKTSNQKGEAGELDLFDTLRELFPDHRVTRVPKGEEGVDSLLGVMDNGHSAGLVCLEKKTGYKSFQSDWVTKLRNNMIAKSGDYGVLVTDTFPAEREKGGETFFRPVPRLMVIKPELVGPVTTALIEMIIALSQARLTGDNRTEKADQILNYFDAGQGRPQLLSAIDDITKIAEVIHAFVTSAVSNEKRGMKILAAQSKKLADIVTAINAIIRSDDGVAPF